MNKILISISPRSKDVGNFSSVYCVSALKRLALKGSKIGDKHKSEHCFIFLTPKTLRSHSTGTCVLWGGTESTVLTKGLWWFKGRMNNVSQSSLPLALRILSILTSGDLCGKKWREMLWAALEFFISFQQCTAGFCLPKSPCEPFCSLSAALPPASGKLGSHTRNRGVLSHFCR